MTAFEKGGMRRQLCNGAGDVCWSLHALWDAEILKLLFKNNYLLRNSFIYFNLASSNFNFDLKSWALKMNRFLCIIYQSPTNISIQNYAEIHKDLALHLILLAARNTASILNFERQEP